VNFDTDDSGSGVALEWYTVDGGDRQTGDSVTVSTVGGHEVALGATDNAGNEAQTTVAVSIAEEEDESEDASTDQDNQDEDDSGDDDDADDDDEVASSGTVTGGNANWDFGDSGTTSPTSPTGSDTETYTGGNSPDWPAGPKYRPPRSTLSGNDSGSTSGKDSPKTKATKEKTSGTAKEPSRSRPSRRGAVAPSRLARGKSSSTVLSTKSSPKEPRPKSPTTPRPFAKASAPVGARARKPSRPVVRRPAAPEPPAEMHQKPAASPSWSDRLMNSPVLIAVAEGMAAVGAAALLLVGFLCRQPTPFLRFEDEEGNSEILRNPTRHQILDALNLYLGQVPKVSTLTISAPLEHGRMLLRDGRDYQVVLQVGHGEAILAETIHAAEGGKPETHDAVLTQTLAEVLQSGAVMEVRGRGTSENGDLLARELSRLLPNQTVHSAFHTGLVVSLKPRSSRRQTAFRNGREVTV